MLCNFVTLHISNCWIKETAAREEIKAKINKFSSEHRNSNFTKGQDKAGAPTPHLHRVSKPKCGGDHLVSHDMDSSCF